jgi:type I restriction-modification system DNA methylase subunit
VQLSPAFISFIIIHLLINIHGSANGYGYNWGKQRRDIRKVNKSSLQEREGMKDLIKAYLKEISTITAQGDAREESYYPALKQFLESYPLEKGRKTQVTVLPKKTEAGSPDFRVWDGKDFIVGYIEAKTPGTNLDQIETSKQLQRYLSTFPNLILTDFYEFRLYRDGKLMQNATIARQFTARVLKTTPQVEQAEQFQALMEQFFGFKLPRSFTAESLAVELAKRTRFLRDEVISQELIESEQQHGELYGYYQAFQKYLIPNLTPEQFADLYSQTITYGLFAARTRANSEFNRKMAFDYIPHTTGILRDVFRFISLGDLPLPMEVLVDDIAAILHAAEINGILNQYYKEGKGEDPIVHFYETFLNQYDPQTRERRGVYYTPEPVVQYIVRSVHSLLKTHFGLPDGLADPAVTLLDPAAGTLTFPAEAIKLAVQEYVQKYGGGGKANFIRNQILKNYYAFELMMAPYAIGHMKISYLLEALGYRLQEDESFKLYLTNTLEMEKLPPIDIPFMSSLSEESRKALEVKAKDILVIMGNPPYSGISANINAWTEKLLKEDLDGAQSYYTVDGKPLGERNSKLLQDDYVKFLRFAQWKIHKAGQGILAMITNHGYLDNITFRGMRQSLMQTFDEIYVLDLHGNSLKNETAPDGSPDENVFDIRQGVAISIFVKTNNKKMHAVFHKDLFGIRESKYAWLKENEFSANKYNQIAPAKPFLLFIPYDVSKIKHYSDWIKITDIFPANLSGIKTHRDKLAISVDKQSLMRNIEIFRNLSYTDDFVKEFFKLSEKSGWKIHPQREEFQRVIDLDGYIKEILYRPFDKRYIFYHPNIVTRMRTDFMRHMLKENLALCTVRQIKTGDRWQHILATDKIVDICYVSNRTSEICYLFPLYLYNTENENAGLYDILEPEKKPNISPSIFSTLKNKCNTDIRAEEIIYYIYAILYSNTYREIYFDFLKYDFPRVPFTADSALFQQMAALGKRLVDLHLLRSPELEQPIARFEGKGEDRTIATPKYDPKTKRVWINATYYFEGITPEVWQYQIGGYQVLDKYLKARKDRSLEDPRHILRVATALARTIEVQKEIDALYPQVEENLITF